MFKATVTSIEARSRLKKLEGFVEHSLRLVIIITVLVASILGLDLAHQASAAQPITTIEKFDNTFTFDCPQGFTAIEHYVGSETIRRFSNGAQQAAERVNATFTNSVSGLSLSSETPFLYKFTPTTVTVVGATFRLNKPGQGVISLDAGRAVYDAQTGEVIFDSGPSDAQLNICTVLE